MMTLRGGRAAPRRAVWRTRTPRGALPSLGACPLRTLRGGGRSTRGTAAARTREDRAPCTGRRREGAHCTMLQQPHKLWCAQRGVAAPRDVHAGLEDRVGSFLLLSL